MQILNEGYWVTITPPNSTTDYYAYITNSKKYPEAEKIYDLITNPVMWKNRTHELLDKRVADRFQRELQSSGLQGDELVQMCDIQKDVHAPVEGRDAQLTTTGRDMRGQGGTYLSQQVKAAIAADGYDLEKLYIHHIDKNEFNQNDFNLVAIPYNQKNAPDLEGAAIIHKLLQALINNTWPKYAGEDTLTAQYYFDGSEDA